MITIDTSIVYSVAVAQMVSDAGLFFVARGFDNSFGELAKIWVDPYLMMNMGREL